ncbi:uncharacterized protein LOC131544593 [Onychostoma macrolepis]|uniref:uncharacterized protein LOC131544593 n=1 Tax=Onychostoma macrolepis TaxID=369639 RepID=UPI00272D365E|nr:uncharacterized protein LOC131544593 [Onychostoma macrolepis]
MPPLDQDQTQELGHPSPETATPSAASASLSTPLKIIMHSQKVTTVERGTETTNKRQDMTTGFMTKEEQKIEPDNLDEEGPRDGEVQITGPKGPIMVFCPWSVKDLKEAMTRLPQPKDSGGKFAAELLVFCQDLKCLLMLKLGTKDWQKVRPHFPVNNAARIHVEWAHDYNRPYRNAVELLCQRVKTAFPVRVDIAKINSCIQGKDELVMDYYEILYETFKKYSGIAEPANRGDPPNIWESYLNSSFLNGLRPELSAAVKQSCIGWNEARVEIIRKHAVHAEE